MENKRILRPLSRIEQAFTILNEVFPLTAIGVIRMADGPSPERLRRAVDRLQQEHPVLRVAIHRRGRRFCFQQLENPPPIALEHLRREGDHHWQEVAAGMLNEGFDLSAGPLMRFCYLQGGGAAAPAELIVAYHHAIGDALSGLHCLHQLLSWCAGVEDMESGGEELPPAVEKLFPRGFRGLSLAGKLAAFLGRQLGEELTFRRRNAGLAVTPIPERPANGLLLLSLDPETSRKLIGRSRREQVSMAGVLATAMLMAVWEKRYRKSRGVYRVVLFSDLRPFLKPPPGTERLACYNSLLRFSQELNQGSSFWDVARAASRQIYLSGKRGERYLYALLSKSLVRMSLRLATERMGTVALSYVGPVDLKSTYGATKILGVHGSVTNNPLGAELSAFGKIIDGRIELDLQYLIAGMDAAAAEDLVRKVEQLLVSAMDF